MGPAMIVGEVVVENALSMLLVFEDDVVEAVPAQGAYDPLAEGIGRGRARWCGEGRVPSPRTGRWKSVP